MDADRLHSLTVLIRVRAGDFHFLLRSPSPQVSNLYGCMHQKSGHTLRATFIIDPAGVLRQFSFNEPPVGRSIPEVLRLVKAFQFHDKNGEVCPAEWKEGAPTVRILSELNSVFFMFSYLFNSIQVSSFYFISISVLSHSLQIKDDPVKKLEYFNKHSH